MHIVYFIKRPLSERDAERFGIHFLLGHGHKVSVIDLSDVIFPELADARDPYAEQLDVDVHGVRRWSELRSLQGLVASADLVISLVRSFGLCSRTFRVFQLLRKARTPYLVIAPLVEPGFSRPGSRRPLWDRVKSLISKLRFDDISASVLSRIPMRYLNLPSARYVVYNGSESQFANCLVGPDTIPIYAHAHDYDLYIEAKRNLTEEKNQAVFLDQNIPYHPETVANKLTPVNPNTYYESLNAALDKIQDSLGIDIIVAGHPRADQTVIRRHFPGRKVVFGQTARAVAESRLVLCHFSRSTNFAFLFRKPIFFMTTRDLYEWIDWMPYYLDNLCRELRTELNFYDVPEQLNLDNVFLFDEDAYDRYVSRYIKAPDSPERPYWDVIHEAINQDAVATQAPQGRGLEPLAANGPG